MKKIDKETRSLAAKALADYVQELWAVKTGDTVSIMLNESLYHNGQKTLTAILEPFIGPIPRVDNQRRPYWVAVKLDIIYESQDVWLTPKNLAINNIREGIEIRKGIGRKQIFRGIRPSRTIVNLLNEWQECRNDYPKEERLLIDAITGILASTFEQWQDILENSEVCASFDEIDDFIKHTTVKYLQYQKMAELR
jgi:hypothetical protein